MRIKAIATDVDGVLTETRETFRLDLDAVKALRQLASKGIDVLLVSANAYQILAGLARYLGIKGPIIAENGCIVFYEEKLFHVSKSTTKPVLKDVLKKYRKYVKQSWQNRFKIHDFTLKIKEPYRRDRFKIYNTIRNFIVKKGYDNLCKVQYTYYRIFLTPVDGGKDKGLRKALRLINVDVNETLGIGDSLNDIDFLKIVGYRATVQNAEESVKEIADFISSKPSGKGFAEIAKWLISCNFNI